MIHLYVKFNEETELPHKIETDSYIVIRQTALVVGVKVFGAGRKIEQRKEREPMDIDNNVVIVGGQGEGGK